MLGVPSRQVLQQVSTKSAIYGCVLFATSVPSKLEGPWYQCSPVGKEKLRKYLAMMCEDAGITERKTNHSLRATGTTALFSAGVPEKNHSRHHWASFKCTGAV